MSLILAPAAPSVVQAAAPGATFTAILSAAPGAGNFLIAMGYQATTDPTASPTVASGWTLIDVLHPSITGQPAPATLAYRQAVSGESATQTPFALNGSPAWPNGFGMAIAEVTGVPAAWADALQGYNFAEPTPSGDATTTNTATTTSQQTLALGFSGWEGSDASFAIVFNSGWNTEASSSHSRTGHAGADSQIVASQTFPGLGSTATLTAQLSPPQPFYGMASAMVLLNPA